MAWQQQANQEVKPCHNYQLPVKAHTLVLTCEYVNTGDSMSNLEATKLRKWECLKK